MTLTAQLMPGDTTPPSNPTAMTVRQAGGKIVEIIITASPPADWGTTIFYRNTTNDSGTAVEIGRGKTKQWTDQDTVYGRTYYYWAKVADGSGNLSGFSPSSGHSITVAQIVTGDVGNSQIGTSQMIAQSATTAVRQLVNTQSTSLGTISPGNGAYGTFSVDTGAVNLVTPIVAVASGNKTLSVYVDNSLSNQVGVWVYNWATSGNANTVTLTINYW